MINLKKNHFSFSFKKRHSFPMILLTGILLTGLLFSACGINQQASALKALRNCKFELAGVDSLTLAGTDLSPLLRGEEINLSRVPAIAFGYLNQNLPLAASLQLQVENPTKKLAGIRQFQYVVLLDNTEILDGTSDLVLEVPAGATTVTPVRLQANIYKLITNGDNLQKLLAFFEREGSNAPSHQVDLTFKIKPTISLGNKGIDYPGYITVQKKLDRANVSRLLGR